MCGWFNRCTSTWTWTVQWYIKTLSAILPASWFPHLCQQKKNEKRKKEILKGITEASGIRRRTNCQGFKRQWMPAERGRKECVFYHSWCVSHYLTFTLSVCNTCECGLCHCIWKDVKGNLLRQPFASLIPFTPDHFSSWWWDSPYSHTHAHRDMSTPRERLHSCCCAREQDSEVNVGVKWERMAGKNEWTQWCMREHRLFEASRVTA
jgi:hypothetical protein